MKLEFNLKGCYGIKDLSYCFKDVSLPLVIHAPNGTMKTSLKKTLEDLGKGNAPKDLVSGVPASSCSVLLDGVQISANQIKTFAYDEKALSDLNADVATMLASDDDKKDYQAALNLSQQKKADLLQAIKPVFSNRADSAEKAITDTFGGALDTVLLAYTPKQLLRVPKPLIKIEKYSNAFSKAIADCVKPASKIIRDYSALLGRALKKSRILKKGTFELSDLEAVAQVLSSHGFFDAKHKVVFNMDSGEKEVDTSSAMDHLIHEIKKFVSSDPDVSSAFSLLQGGLVKKGVEKKPLKLMEDQPVAATYYANYDRFQKRFVLGVLQDHIDKFTDARNAIIKERKVRRDIACKAARGLTEWKEAAAEFNRRFDTKYKMIVRDAEGDFMTGQAAHIDFVFDDCPASPKNLEEIKGILSSGELRSLFLLDVVFQTRKLFRSSKPYLLLYDDISDSFDYANKNCIMEYFKELASQSVNGCMLILTHNFDFYRLFAYRISNRQHAYFAASEQGVIHISEGGYLKDVLNNGIISKASTSISASFALIPFARGIVELTSEKSDIKDDDHYKFLCKVMHYRPDGARLSLGRVKREMSFNQRIRNSIFTDGTPPSRNYYKELQKACDAIATRRTLDQRLEEKLCLALGIRVFSEKYCYQKLRNRHDLTVSMGDLLTDSFGKMLEEFTNHFPRDPKRKDLELAAMLTAPDLHLNGFAYEPLIDYSIVRLRSLYLRIMPK